MDQTTRTNQPGIGEQIGRITFHTVLALGVLALIVLAGGDVNNWAGGR